MIQTNTCLHSTALVPSLKNLLSSYPIGVIRISTSFQTLENKARATGPSKSKQLIILLLHTGTKTSCLISRGWRACPAHAHLRFKRSHALLARAGCARWTCDDINAHTLKFQGTNLCVRPMHTRASECPTQSEYRRHLDNEDRDKLEHRSSARHKVSTDGTWTTKTQTSWSTDRVPDTKYVYTARRPQRLRQVEAHICMEEPHQ